MGTYIYRLLAKYTTETYSGVFSITSNILQKPTKIGTLELNLVILKLICTCRLFIHR